MPLGSLLNSVAIMCKVHEQFVQRKKLFVQMTKKFLMRIWSGGRGVAKCTKLLMSHRVQQLGDIEVTLERTQE